MERGEFWERQYKVFHCKLYILFHFQKLYFTIKLHEILHEMSITVFHRIGELTVNHLAGFYCSIFTVFYR